jgi:SnoaL-like domain
MTARDSDQRVDRFLQELAILEQTGDPDPITSCYHPEATAGSVQAGEQRGLAGVRKFWVDYRSGVGHALSRYRSIIVSPHKAALEWHTDLDGTDGYEGVTVLDFDSDLVTRSWAYFNPRAVNAPIHTS